MVYYRNGMVEDRPEDGLEPSKNNGFEPVSGPVPSFSPRAARAAGNSAPSGADNGMEVSEGIDPGLNLFGEVGVVGPNFRGFGV